MVPQRNAVSKVPAIVVGLDLNGLGLVRALHGAGIPVVGLDTDLTKPTARTRYGAKIRVAALSGPSFVQALLELRGRFVGNPVLFLTQEASTVTVSAEREVLARAYRFAMPAAAVMEQLLSKTGFQALAEEHGFPIPRAVRVSGMEGLDAVQALRFPCAVKPSRKDFEYAKRFAKAYKVDGPDDAARLWSQMREVVDEIIVQEWIAGSDSDVYFCLQYRPAAREPAVSFAGRKICQWPLLVGGTASCMPAPEAAKELISLTDRFFSVVGFTGLCSMEYKRDARDGRFIMVEPTVGRTDYQEEIAALNGVNIPLAAYCDAVGMPLPVPKTVAPPVAWRDPAAYARARMAGAPDPSETISAGIRTCDAYFRFDDPMPYIALKLQALMRRLRIG